jgi:hypothetical protein
MIYAASSWGGARRFSHMLLLAIAPIVNTVLLKFQDCRSSNTKTLLERDALRANRSSD